MESEATAHSSTGKPLSSAWRMLRRAEEEAVKPPVTFLRLVENVCVNQNGRRSRRASPVTFGGSGSGERAAGEPSGRALLPSPSLPAESPAARGSLHTTPLSTGALRRMTNAPWFTPHFHFSETRMFTVYYRYTSERIHGLQLLLPLRHKTNQ